MLPQQRPPLTPDSIVKRMNSVRPGAYWQVNNPLATFLIKGAEDYVRQRYPNAQGFDRFVYWPDYRVAGTINDIYNRFAQAGVSHVIVGQLYTLSNGQVGCPPQTVPLSPQIIASCAIDPLNPVHVNIFPDIIGGDIYQNKPSREFQSRLTNELTNLAPAGPLFPGGIQFQQQAQNLGQMLSDDLSYLPPRGAFPGGSVYRQGLNETMQGLQSFYRG